MFYCYRHPPTIASADDDQGTITATDDDQGTITAAADEQKRSRRPQEC
jgi:hypothetical protein